ncbi:MULTISPECIES: SulP family inorganic anion transporter [unclassified Fusibacter]|uniref:SulP family inorganic anion transporter n=1 Tax=unclassified Fusibacter TaxID=2624464 RepID=UPI0010112A7F|nr:MULTISPECIES: SulP family inorganic anion transporter [unclassified Fusibacter]MCK8058607.1 SulP family inorganic anion transporter [Fusibacter sp. A2]NPE22623.1 SulP family inorganic anion transporter [Fusibacter sp. A1]RXV60187.1 SulP family inorganic anion transporter [Fusibacter sp. A1]
MYSLTNKLPSTMKDNVLSGITVALALVPEAIAFSFVAGVDPLVGLYTAFIIGLITSAFGGRPGMISGATGAIAVVITELVLSHGLEYLFAAVILMGLLQILAGLFKLGKFIRLVPHTVMIGFVNGLALVIFISQFEHFKVDHHWLTGMPLLIMAGLTLLTMGIIKFFPKLTKAVPATLASIAFVTLLVNIFNIDTRTVGDLATISGGLPKFHIPNVPASIDMLITIIPYSVIMATIGLIESLMTMSLIDETTDTRGHGNRECIGQGVANIVCGVFGGMGGCAMIGQSMLNIQSGGTRRISGITAALSLLAFILFGSSLISIIPIAALVGIMFVVVIATFEWTTLSIINKIPKSDALVIIVVTIVTVFTNLAVSVALGIILSALVFAWNKGKNVTARTRMEDCGSKVYLLDGPLFFASIKNFQDIFTINEDPDDVIIDFMNSHVHDHSAIAAIDAITAKYLASGKTIHLRHLSSECKELLENAKDFVEVNILEDPRYHVASDKLA